MTTAAMSMPYAHRVRLRFFHAAGRLALASFQRQTRRARAVNAEVLREMLTRNAPTEFGRRHGFADLLQAPDVLAAYGRRMPLSTYADYEADVARIGAGARNVLTSDPVTLLAGSAGTTGRPKLIPRTRRAQRHHLKLVVLAEQAVINQGVRGATDPRRGVNLMSLYAPPAPAGGVVPVMSGPNSGMRRIRRQIRVFWSSPVEVFGIAHQSTAQYLHALFALRDRDTLYIETPFAPQVVGWFTQMERRQASLLQDLAQGTLAEDLQLSPAERASLQAHLSPDPVRAREVRAAFEGGMEGIIPRLWPRIRYVRTVTSGSFAVSLPRLRWLAGPELPIHSGCHSSSEGVIGINLSTDGRTEYALACGAAYFEFIPLQDADSAAARTCQLADLQVGQEYEVVLTTEAGLYRYRLGDVVRITGWYHETPTFEFLYRRGTLLNLVGEKVTEHQTSTALTAALDGWLGTPGALREYSVHAELREGIARYVFYVELQPELSPPRDTAGAVIRDLDHRLALLNPYYQSNGRDALRMELPDVRFVAPGTFEAMAEMRLAQQGTATATQLKVPRVINAPEQLALLAANVVG